MTITREIMHGSIGGNLWLADPPEGPGREGDHLGVDALVVPVAEQQVELAVVLERLLLPLRHVHDQRPVQPRRPLHPVVPVVEVRPRLRGHGNKGNFFIRPPVMTCIKKQADAYGWMSHECVWPSAAPCRRRSGR